MFVLLSQNVNWTLSALSEVIKGIHCAPKPPTYTSFDPGGCKKAQYVAGWIVCARPRLLQRRMKNKGGLCVSHILFIVVNVDTVGLKADG